MTEPLNWLFAACRSFRPALNYVAGDGDNEKLTSFYLVPVDVLTRAAAHMAG